MSVFTFSECFIKHVLNQLSSKVFALFFICFLKFAWLNPFKDQTQSRITFAVEVWWMAAKFALQSFHKHLPNFFLETRQLKLCTVLVTRCCGGPPAACAAGSGAAACVAAKIAQGGRCREGAGLFALGWGVRGGQCLALLLTSCFA